MPAGRREGERWLHVTHTPHTLRQVALWLTTCRPGAYLICRHVYEDDPLAPRPLRDQHGQYVGGVYVIGRVEEFPTPQTDADVALVEHIEDTRLATLRMERRYLHFVARVRFFALGYLEDLKPTTKGYIDQVCQPTLN